MNRFDLETAITTWRQFHAYRRAFLREDVDELERHLRDFIAHEQAQGLDEEAAFRAGVANMGDLGGGSQEYGKVYWGKIRRRRQLIDEFIWRLSMFKNYLKIGRRSLSRQKSYTFINITGLATGMAAFLIILQYVAFESSYDSVPDADRIYRIRNNYVRFGGLIYDSAGTFPGIGPTLKETLGEVEEYARIFNYNEEYATIFTNEESPNGPITIKETRVLFVDASFTELFEVQHLAGDPRNALASPNSVALTESAARKYFGEEDPIGQTLRFNDDARSEHLLTVTAVVRDSPTNSHLPYDVLVSYNTLFLREGGVQRYDTWWSGEAKYHTYLRLRKGARPSSVLAVLPELLDRYKPDYQETNEAGERLRKNEFYMDPIRDIHSASILQNDISVNGNGKSVKLLFLIAALILGIAWINYVNLASARAVLRSKEVGVRKVLGSTRGQLLQQFLFEALLINLIAFILAVLLVQIAQPFLTSLLGMQIPQIGSNPTVVLIVITLYAAGALVAGVSPALFLSSFSPIGALKSRARSRITNSLQRKFLVVFQFSVAMMLIVGTLTVYQQLNFMKSSDLGFDAEQMLVIQRPGILSGSRKEGTQRMIRFKESVSQITGVVDIAGSGVVPGQMILRGLAMSRGTDEDRPFESIEGVAIDYSFFETYNMEFVSGRAFSTEYADSNSIILNETAIQVLGYASPEKAIGQSVIYFGEAHPIVGVIKDYHQESLHRPYDPMFFIPSSANAGGIPFFSIKIHPADFRNTLASIEAVYQVQFPGNPFEHFFLDSYFNAQYSADNTFGRLFLIFAGLAVFIACLGLYGLSTFVTTRRTREIGIRKVNGASPSGIIKLLAKEFLSPVAVSFLIAVPLSYLALVAWLDTFAFRVGVSPATYMMAGTIILVIALGSIIRSSLVAARMQPVEALRHE